MSRSTCRSHARLPWHLLPILLPLVVMGCGPSASGPYIGVWEVTEVEIAPDPAMEMTEDLEVDVMGAEAVFSDITFILEEDGSYVLEDRRDGEIERGQWEVGLEGQELAELRLTNDAVLLGGAPAFDDAEIIVRLQDGVPSTFETSVETVIVESGWLAVTMTVRPGSRQNP